MRKQLRITQYLIQNSIYIIFLSIFLCLISCGRTEYLKNKFEIDSFTASLNNDSTISLNFKLKYFTDSTHENGSASIEKGQDGSNQKILYFGFDDSISRNRYIGCNLMNINDFIYGFNRGNKEFIGQELERQKTICISASKINYDDKLVMILQNEVNHKIDTLIGFITTDKSKGRIKE
jgi:hypothetical protein